MPLFLLLARTRARPNSDFAFFAFTTFTEIRVMNCV